MEDLRKHIFDSLAREIRTKFRPHQGEFNIYFIPTRVTDYNKNMRLYTLGYLRVTRNESVLLLSVRFSEKNGVWFTGRDLELCPPPMAIRAIQMFIEDIDPNPYSVRSIVPFRKEYVFSPKQRRARL